MKTIKTAKEEYKAAKRAYRDRVNEDPEVKALFTELAALVQQRREEGATRKEIAEELGTKDPYTLIGLLQAPTHSKGE